MLRLEKMMFNGEKLTELRLLCGLSRAELAEKLDLTEQAIWQFETNKNEPKINPTLFSLANIFKVDLSYFQEETSLQSIDTARIAFRNADITSKKSIKIQEAYLNKVHSFVQYIESFLIAPNWIFYELENDIAEKERGIAEIAHMARAKLSISGNNSDLLYKLELSGINILERLINGEADAYSLWTKDDTPYIVLGRGKSAVRRNFDLAHELGHLLLHKNIDFDELNKYDYQQKEYEANQFAADFLLPEEDFKKDFTSLVRNKFSNPESYLLLKEKYNVSIQALEMRAYKMGYLSQSENSYFYRLLNSKYKSYKTVEPLDRQIPIKRPAKIKSILDTLFTSNLISLQELLQEQRIRLEFLSLLLEIDLEFFDKYKASSDDFSGVIRLDDFRRMG
ncbi:XRE family transcriptional regulator [Lactovum odontotermitis]